MFLSESNSHHHLVAVLHQRLAVYRMHWGSLNVCGGCGLDMTIESCDKDDGATHVYLDWKTFNQGRSIIFPEQT